MIYHQIMDNKLELTVDKTIVALNRIKRFLDKYGEKLDAESIAKIESKIKELELSVKRLS